MKIEDKMLLGALREIDNTKSKYSSKLRDSFQKTITRKLYLYPWTVLDLDELSQVRQLPLNTLASEILNQVAQLWQRFPTDRNLFLKRVEDPANADVVVDTETNTDEVAVSLDSSEVWDRRMVILAVHRYLEAHQDLGFLRDLLEELDG
jgi:hypothetical protein